MARLLAALRVLLIAGGLVLLFPLSAGCGGGPRTFYPGPSGGGGGPGTGGGGGGGDGGGGGADQTAGTITLIAGQLARESRQVNLRVGQTLILKLVADSTTGHMWRLDPDNLPALREPTAPLRVSTRKIEMGTSSAGGLLGGSKYHTFRITGTRPGSANLRFQYDKVNQPDLGALRVLNLSVKVQ